MNSKALPVRFRRWLITLLIAITTSAGAQTWQAGIKLTPQQIDSIGIDNCFKSEAISDAIFQRMSGRSFPAHCTIARSQLRYLRVLHRNAEGQTLTGEMVCNKIIADRLITIFRQLYDASYPIERMVLIDNYDADDERSMADNNSSCFCFRTVAGTQHLSKHARGLAVDINTLYNPYVRFKRNGATTVSPVAGRRWANRELNSPYKIEKDDMCYRLFLENGFIWGGNWRTMKDYQHFELP